MAELPIKGDERLWRSQCAEEYMDVHRCVFYWEHNGMHYSDTADLWWGNGQHFADELRIQASAGTA